MIQFKDEVIIKAPPSKVFGFLTNIDKLYKQWHPKDHVFCKVLHGCLDRKGGILHFFEWVGGFPLYLIAQVSKVEKNRYIEFIPVFPFSLFRLGLGSFEIQKISKNETKLVAYVNGGYKTPIVGLLLDSLAKKLISFDAIRKHMKEEGENIKKYLEHS